MKHATSYLLCNHRWLQIRSIDKNRLHTIRYGRKCANGAVAISVSPPTTHRFPLMPPLMFIRAQLTVCSIFLAFINFGFADYVASQSHGNGCCTYLCAAALNMGSQLCFSMYKVSHFNCPRQISLE